MVELSETLTSLDPKSSQSDDLDWSGLNDFQDSLEPATKEIEAKINQEEERIKAEKMAEEEALRQAQEEADRQETERRLVQEEKKAAMQELKTLGEDLKDKSPNMIMRMIEKLIESLQGKRATLSKEEHASLKSVQELNDQFRREGSEEGNVIFAKDMIAEESVGVQNDVPKGRDFIEKLILVAEKESFSAWFMRKICEFLKPSKGAHYNPSFFGSPAEKRNSPENSENSENSENKIPK